MVFPYQRHQKEAKQQASLFDISQLHNKSFWIWDKEEHLTEARASNGNCCFNHIVGAYPLFDYEKMIP
jgi:hypothetical protein